MKGNAKKNEEPPALSDLQGWRQAGTKDRLGRFPPEDVVAQIQQIGPNGDQRLLNALMGHVSDEMLRILRRHVGSVKAVSDVRGIGA
jgi:hypothetical protein